MDKQIPFTECCPECNGDGWKWDSRLNPLTFGKDPDCPTCNGTGIIEIYYSPEQWKKLGGRLEENETPCWCRYRLQDINLYYEVEYDIWRLMKYSSSLVTDKSATMIIARPEQPKPSIDWRKGL